MRPFFSLVAHYRNGARGTPMSVPISHAKMTHHPHGEA